jgi:hypothetical protein
MHATALRWDSAPARALVDAGDFGGLIRWARAELGWRQVDLAAAVTYSTASISRLEHTTQPNDLDVVRIFAHALLIPPAVLSDVLRLSPSVAASVSSETGGRDLTRRANPAGSPPLGPIESEAAVLRRREMLNGMFGLAAAPALGVHSTLYHPAGTPTGIPQLLSALTAARADFQATRYSALNAKLASLSANAAATRDATAGRARDSASAILSRAYCLVSELATKQAKVGNAWVASDRALGYARASGDPISIAEAATRLSVAMRQDEQFSEATNLLTSTALTLQPDLNDRRALSAYGSVLLVAAYTEAQAGNRANVTTLMQEAEDAARRMGEPITDFSTEQCQLYRISTHTALGDAVALDYARYLNAAALPTTERKSRYWTDVARAWNMVGNPAQTLAALEASEEVSGEDVRRPSMQKLATELLADSPNLVRLVAFADRIGAARS